MIVVFRLRDMDIDMLELTKPLNHDRLNSCVFDQIFMDIDGDVFIPGEWDCYDTLGYLEQRLKQNLIATLRDDGSMFFIRGKAVCFAPDGVTVSHYRR